MNAFTSDTLRIHTKILEAAPFLKNAIKETKGDDAKQALFISSEHLSTAARAFDVRKLIEQGELAVGKPFNNFCDCGERYREQRNVDRRQPYAKPIFVRDYLL